MHTRIYLSNISPMWPIERQEALLDEQLPGWRKFSVYKDTISAAKRKSHPPGVLVERDTALLRELGAARQDPEMIVVCAWPVLTFGPTDLNWVIGRAEGRNATIRVLHPSDRHLPPDASKADVSRAVKEAENAKVRPGKGHGSIVGRNASILSRAEDIKQRIETFVKPNWHLRTYTDKELGILAGKKRRGHVVPMAMATMVLHMGGDRRRTRQLLYEAQEKSRLERAARKAAALAKKEKRK